MINTVRISLRSLARNKRRTFFSALALGIGVALVIFIAAVLRGEMNTSRESLVRLESGHLQIQMIGYESSKSSLKFETLLAQPGALAEKVNRLPYVRAATPRLVASGVISTFRDSAGVRIIGIDPASLVNEPVVGQLSSGSAITAEDRDGLMMGKALADQLRLAAGDRVSVMVNTSSGESSVQDFTIRGLFNTGYPSYDRTAVFLPLSKAQTITGVGDRASLIFILLKDGGQMNQAAAAMHSGQYKVLTFNQLNILYAEMERMSNGYLAVIYIIVLGITSAVIVNTLLMSVFERTREIGVLAAIGMQSRRIMALFLTEAFFLACLGVIIGVLLGALMGLYSERVGFFIGEYAVSGFLLSDRLYGQLALQDVINLSLLAFFITLVGAIYPAWVASRMEPVEAMRGGKLE